MVKYTTYIQGAGWQNYMYDGLTSGTVGQTSMIEGIKIETPNNSNLGVQYSANVQDIGWQNYVSGGAMSGTEGQSKRLEAIKIKLTGSDAALYDVYYRVYAQYYGWLSWAKNDIAAGTEGLSKYLSAIEINIVLKSDVPTVDMTKPFAKLNGIEITKLPNKTTYNLSDLLDLAGLEVSRVDNLSNREVITTGYTVSGYNSNIIGNQTITITYGSYAATFTVAVIVPETEGITNGHTYYLKNKQSGKYLDIYGDGTANQTKVQQYHFINGCLTEQWKVTYVENGCYTLQVMHTNNRYLDATINPINNTWTQIYEYEVCDEQLWNISPNPDGSFGLSTKRNGYTMYLGIENASSSDNAKAVTYEYNSSKNDECWYFEAIN